MNSFLYLHHSNAKVAQLVELQPSKLVVASSSLVFRSKTSNESLGFLFVSFYKKANSLYFNAKVAQLVELQPSKLVVASSSLVFRSKNLK